MKKTAEQLVAEANAEIETLSVDEARIVHDACDAVLVDIRDIRELNREGRVPGAVHAPRGMFEFWVDPQSRYHKEVFAQRDKKYVFFCAAGWRSALANKAMQDMGLKPVAHIDGGFGAWREAEAPIDAPEPAGENPKAARA